MSQMPSDIAAHNRALIEDWRTNGAPPGRALLLLTTTGRRSGEPRTTPMMYVRSGDKLLVIASNAGATKAPDWFHNLVADPRVHVEIGDESYDATALVPTGDERAPLWEDVTTQFPFFAEHATRAGREIPVVELVRA